MFTFFTKCSFCIGFTPFHGADKSPQGARFIFLGVRGTIFCSGYFLRGTDIFDGIICTAAAGGGVSNHGAVIAGGVQRDSVDKIVIDIG